MSLRSLAHRLLRQTPARYLYHRLKLVGGGGPQSDEALILSRLTTNAVRTFAEFGFHPTEYNCIGLQGFRGLLVDGDEQTVRLARKLLPAQITVRHSFITLENVHEIGAEFPALGVLSIDVDGNDYWFLRELLPRRPGIIVVEYNASLGLEPVTVPYDPQFDRSRKHVSGWYHGASLMGLSMLCKRHDYKLVAVSQAGGNAFFAPLGADFPGLDPATAYRESELRNRWSGTTARDQWAGIRDMPFVRCDGSDPLAA